MMAELVPSVNYTHTHTHTHTRTHTPDIDTGTPKKTDFRVSKVS